MSKNTRIVPAILTDDRAALATMVKQTETFTGYAQIDIMDGRFVPSKSIACADIAGLETSLDWEAHLMVLKPETCFEDFKQAGARKVIFHYEATPSPQEVISQARRTGLEVGLAINPGTEIPAFEHLVEKVDSVLFLSVVPGYYGSKFIPEVLEKISAFRRKHPELETGIDGGIKENNIELIARSGVDVICVGSAIFLQPEPGESFRRLQALAESSSPV